MRKLLLAATAGCLFATPALADDADWTGAYAGVNVGYTDADSDQTIALGGAWSSESAALQSNVTSFYPNDTKVEDVNFGAQLGYNMQTGSGMVLGIEADVSVLSGSGTTAKPLTPTTPFPALSYATSTTFDPKASYGVRARVGFASGNTLFYAAGGWRWTDADITMDITSNGGYHKTVSVSETFDGFQIGGGIEQRLGGNASVRLDYTYADQGDATYSSVYAAGSAFTTPAYNETFTSDLRMHMVRLGVNFHF